MKLHLPNPIQIISPARARRGMALVITLIMLSVTLVMAIAFLAVSNRERAAVTTSADEANARLALSSALNAAQAQILANVIASGSGTYNFGLLVSTNFINSYGFVANDISPTNINFDYRSTGAALQAGDFEANVANLLYFPRAPVMVSAAEPNGRFYLDLNRNGVFDQTIASTNPPLPLEYSKFFVDENGNTNFNVANVQVGDPQWIGALERPDTVHSPNNLFTYRYAFIAVPIGNGLDINHIHNEVLDQSLGSLDGFLRNQGVGSWEINLAGFLADLNTNQWLPASAYYNYNEPSGSANIGVAFDDARALLSWRYNYNYNTLSTADSLFGSAASIFPFDNIDEYGNGPLQFDTANISESSFANQDAPGTSWAGSDSTNHFFNLTSELFDPTKSSIGFTNRLISAGTYTTNGAQPTYDRYTFYRMLAGMGTESAPDDSGKLNLNYDNTDGHGNIVANAQTNLVAWTPLVFFTNAADRMLRAYTTNWFQSGPSNYLAIYYNTNYNYYYAYTNSSGYGVIVTNDPNGFGLTNVPYFGITNQVPAFGITGIPVYFNTNFVYTSAVNRILQLAANIFDASTNSPFPSVFRPMIGKDVSGNVYITGYTNMATSFSDGVNDPAFSAPFDVTRISALAGTFSNVLDNIYGVPWIIGAKKGFPNFNEFSMENTLAVTRRLQFTRFVGAPIPTITGTNQMYTMGLNSSFGVELWNSYTNTYAGTIVVGMTESNSILLTNDETGFQASMQGANLEPMIFTAATNFEVQNWSGCTGYGGQAGAASFVLPLNTSVISLTNSVYRSHYATASATAGLSAPCLVPTNYLSLERIALDFETNSPNGFHFPQFGLLTTNRLQIYMLDFNQTTHLYNVIDYVQFAGPDSSFNVNSNLADGDLTQGNVGVWNTNYPPGSSAPTGVTYGILNQINISKNATTANGILNGEDGTWKSDPQAYPQGGSQAQQEAAFQAFFKPNNVTQVPVSASNYMTSVEAPYSPTRYVVQYLTWQANDPLVHYLASDIDIPPVKPTTLPLPGVTTYNAGTTIVALTNLNLGFLNDRYTPWGGNPSLSTSQRASVDPNLFNMAERDPLLIQPDDWDFPTNRYPTVGWLGRVHRGTPWQTVYMKSANIMANTNGLLAWQAWTGNGNQFDANNAAPLQDDVLFDIFTTALDDNTSRGTLSVNQTQLSDWSALLDGVIVLTNVTPTVDNADPQPTNGFIVINPAGADTNSALWQIVNGTNGINAVRSNPALFPSGAFARPGDIVRVPALTQFSPFINQSDATHQEYDVSDEVYERIPQQIMGLLPVGSPRYVIFCYGQALRPAQDGIALDLAHNGLVTNYQVVAQSLARAVVSVHPQMVYRPPAAPTTNYTTSVDSYNLLPPN